MLSFVGKIVLLIAAAFGLGALFGRLKRKPAATRDASDAREVSAATGMPPSRTAVHATGHASPAPRPASDTADNAGSPVTGSASDPAAASAGASTPRPPAGADDPGETDEGGEGFGGIRAAAGRAARQPALARRSAHRKIQGRTVRQEFSQRRLFEAFARSGDDRSPAQAPPPAFELAGAAARSGKAGCQSDVRRRRGRTVRFPAGSQASAAPRSRPT